MTKPTRRTPLALAAAAGLAAASAAHAQYDVVNNIAGTFVDISTTGTVIPLTQGTTDDGGGTFTSSVTNALVTASALWAGTNGMVTDFYNNTWTNGPLPMSGYTIALCPLWDDLVMDGPGAKIVHKSAVEGGINVEIIEWYQARAYSGSTGYGNFEIKIFQSGPVFVQYLFQGSTTWIASGSSATVGAQWGSNSFAQYGYNTPNAVPAGAVLSVVSAPSGACCLPNLGGCVISGQSSCTSQGGTYQGNGTNCAAANCPGPTLGPDIINDCYDVGVYQLPANPPPTLIAYAVGTNACNIGDSPANWISGTPAHPVIAQNMFRYMQVGGAYRFEQVGLSWLKHGFASTNSPDYCTPCFGPPNGGAQLGVGCSDIYGAGLNGSQGYLGPRSEVNATTGVFPYPFNNAGNDSSAIGKRIQCLISDVTPAQNPGALYFVDTHYIAADDAQWNSTARPNGTNGLNNCTYRQVTGLPTSPSLTGGLHRQVSAIQAWKDQDASVTLVNADYLDSTSIAGKQLTARFIVGAKATSLGGGQYRYEYAIYNINADRSARTFTVPCASGVTVSNMGFHAPLYHSGEPYSNAPWTSSKVGDTVVFTGQNYIAPPATDTANALRWGTLYNYRFDANIAPQVGTATLGLYKPGTPASLVVSGVPVPGNPCYADVNGDGILDSNDFNAFLVKFLAQDPYADCTGDGIWDSNDFNCLLVKFLSGCP